MNSIYVESHIIVEARGILDTKVIERLHGRLHKRNKWDPNGREYLYEIKYAASLAHQGLLGSFKYHELTLHGDLSSVPDEHLASLVSAVGDSLEINNVRGCDLVTILDSIKCESLYINQSLGSKETQALVRAIESWLTVVRLDYVTNSFMDKFREWKLVTIARSRNWNVQKVCIKNQIMAIIINYNNPKL